MSRPSGVRFFVLVNLVCARNSNELDLVREVRHEHFGEPTEVDAAQELLVLFGRSGWELDAEHDPVLHEIRDQDGSVLPLVTLSDMRVALLSALLVGLNLAVLDRVVDRDEQRQWVVRDHQQEGRLHSATIRERRLGCSVSRRTRAR